MFPLLFIEITVEHLYWAGAGILATLGGFGAFATAKKNIGTELWSPFKERFLMPRKTRQKKLDELIESAETLKTQVADIFAEVKPNGGSSIKDVVNRIENQVTRIENQNDWTYAKFRHTDETSPDALFEMDNNLNMTFANRALCELLNADAAEILDRRWLAKIPNSTERNRVIGEWRDAAENCCPLDIRHLIVNGDKKQITVRVRATPRLNRSKELRGFFGNIKIASE